MTTLSFWVEMGLDPGDFWSQTPRLFKAIVSGRLKAMEREFQGRAWQAWHTAVIPLMKTVPTLASLTGEQPTIKKQTPAEMRSVFAAMREAAA